MSGSTCDLGAVFDQQVAHEFVAKAATMATDSDTHDITMDTVLPGVAPTGRRCGRRSGCSTTTLRPTSCC
ncbi:MAG: hypothetical protein JO044_03015 [Mycobacteriaceae bacterium]|nr:hypothetical protein [Mycobacteriaceae bacterium]MBV9641570.1 hypothetical protein [Mycobacteriaceae bacterium]